MSSTSANFCACCGHFISWHTEYDQDAKDRNEGNKCRGGYTSGCDCKKFCIGYEPQERDGLTCDNCGRNYFDHDTMKKVLQGRLLTSDSFDRISSESVCYRVETAGLKLCCRWTLHQFMKRVDVSTLNPGVCIQCVNCKTSGVMVVKEMDDGVPEWKWSYRALPLTETRLVVPPEVGVQP